VKQIVNDVVSAETECVEMMCSLLIKENKLLQNPTVDKVIFILSKWSANPPNENLQELKEFQEQQNTT